MKSVKTATLHFNWRWRMLAAHPWITTVVQSLSFDDVLVVLC